MVELNDLEGLSFYVQMLISQYLFFDGVALKALTVLIILIGISMLWKWLRKAARSS